MLAEDLEIRFAISSTMVFPKILPDSLSPLRSNWSLTSRLFMQRLPFGFVRSFPERPFFTGAMFYIVPGPIFHGYVSLTPCHFCTAVVVLQEAANFFRNPQFPRAAASALQKISLLLLP
jgi:hypothetical protein